MMQELHELLKQSNARFSVTIDLWPMDEVDIWIHDRTDCFLNKKAIGQFNEESLDLALSKAIEFIKAAR